MIQISITLSCISSYLHIYPAHRVSLMGHFYICKLNRKEMSDAALLLGSLYWLQANDTKSLTIQGLELQAAFIASIMKMTLLNEILTFLDTNQVWTESRLVLNYLRSFRSCSDNYVLHRTNETRANKNIAIKR